jgi:hypothetical protein
VRDGRLHLDGKTAHVRTEPLAQEVREKTLDAWVLLGNNRDTEDARLYDRALAAEEVAASYRAGVIHVQGSRRAFVQHLRRVSRCVQAQTERPGC